MCVLLGALVPAAMRRTLYAVTAEPMSLVPCLGVGHNR